MKKFFDNEILMAEIAGWLREGKTVTIPVKGNSMKPFLTDGRDKVTLCGCRAEELSPGDVVLAGVNDGGSTVLHRVVERRGTRLLLQGDANETTEETGLQEVLGKAVAMERKGRMYEVDGKVWRWYSAVWMKVLAGRRYRQKARGMLAYLRQALGGHGRSVGLSCLTGVLSVGLSLLFIYFSKQAIDAATEGRAEELPLWAGVLVVNMLLQLACNAWDNWVAVRAQVGTGNGLRYRIFGHLLRSRWKELERFHTGDVMNRVAGDTATLTSLLTMTLPAFVILGIQLLAAFAFFYWLDARLVWLVVGILPFFLLGSRLYMKRMYGYASRIRRTDSRIQAVIQESLQQRNVVRALEIGRKRLHRLEGEQESLRMRLLKRTRFSIWTRACVSGAFSGGYLVAFCWGVWGLSDGSITFGTMAAFLQLVGKIQQPVWDMARLIPSLVEGMASVRRLRELESLPEEEAGSSLRLAETPDVDVEGIDFAYAPGDRPVFHNFSCRFPAGSRTAVMGETGTGKTTLVRLLLAFDKPQAGAIRLKTGKETVEVSARTRCNFTYVPQGNTLFSGTIRENLRMGNPEATGEAMCRALRTAVADFVFTLPNGLDSFIGEQGSGLSEGQAQRIAIARALLRNSPILLLDEATSALDEETERILMENLERDYTDRTFIFVTHHAAVAERCGQVVKMKNEE